MLSPLCFPSVCIFFIVATAFSGLHPIDDTSGNSWTMYSHGPHRNALSPRISSSPKTWTFTVPNAVFEVSSLILTNFDSYGDVLEMFWFNATPPVKHGPEFGTLWLVEPDSGNVLRALDFRNLTGTPRAGSGSGGYHISSSSFGPLVLTAVEVGDGNLAAINVETGSVVASPLSVVGLADTRFGLNPALGGGQLVVVSIHDCVNATTLARKCGFMTSYSGPNSGDSLLFDPEWTTGEEFNCGSMWDPMSATAGLVCAPTLVPEQEMAYFMTDSCDQRGSTWSECTLHRGLPAQLGKIDLRTGKYRLFSPNVSRDWNLGAALVSVAKEYYAVIVDSHSFPPEVDMISNYLYVFDVKTDKLIFEIFLANSSAGAYSRPCSEEIVISPDESFFVFVCNNALFRVDAKSGKYVTAPLPHEAMRFLSLIILPSSNVVVSGVHYDLAKQQTSFDIFLVDPSTGVVVKSVPPIHPNQYNQYQLYRVRPVADSSNFVYYCVPFWKGSGSVFSPRDYSTTCCRVDFNV